MKQRIFGLFLLLTTLFFCSFSEPTRAEDITTKIVEDEGTYRGFVGGEEYCWGPDFTEVLEELIMHSDSIRLDGIGIEGSVRLPKGSYSFVGSFEMLGDLIVEAGVELTLLAEARVCGAILVRGGSLALCDGVTRVDSGVILDSFASSRLYMTGGSIVSGKSGGAVEIRLGTAEISGGYIKNAVGCAIINSSTLSLGGSVLLESGGVDLLTDKPVGLTASGKPLASVLECEYSSTLAEGYRTEVFYNAKGVDINNIELSDKDGRSRSLGFIEHIEGSAYSDILAVSLPYYIEYYSSTDLIYRQEFYIGDSVGEPRIELPRGFEILGIYKDAYFTEPFTPGYEPTSSIKVYVNVGLSPFSYSINRLKTIYDGKEHSLSFSSLSHPLDGEYSFVWYNQRGEVVSLGESISVKNTADSGIYSCEITFWYLGYSITRIVGDIEVSVEKRRVDIPTIPSADYDGGEKMPMLFSTSLYEVERVGFTEVGEYQIALRLLDTDNYSWQGCDEATAYSIFAITQAQNFWIEEPSAMDIYFGESLSHLATSRFGEVTFLYSKDLNGEYTKEMPSEVGTYYLKAEVKGTSNYGGLLSEGIRFYIMEDIVVSLALISPLSKTEYTSFEYFDRTDLTLLVTYKSGKKEETSGKGVAISYQNADSFRAADNAVLVSYKGVTLPVPIKVNKAEYSLVIPNFIKEVPYNGKYQSIEPNIGMPIGLDGIEPTYKVRGGGRDAGTYTVVVEFYTESTEYIVPKSLHFEFIISPLSVEGVYYDTSFVYDGGIKTPKGYYLDIYGARIPLCLEDGRINAGTGYFAKAYITDSNYILVNDRVEFSIEKAYYDLSGVYWSEDLFTYNGEVHAVSLCGLPKGVEVAGYIDNTGTKAGEYIAEARLVYDRENYHMPTIESHRWVIEKAEYDLSGVSVQGGHYEYSGEYYYPVLKGEMPTGLDGYTLMYRIVEGVREVSVGAVSLGVEFYTESENYNSPATVYVTVEVYPKEIVVEWQGLVTVYNQKAQSPQATAPECEIEVLVNATDAGEYTAQAKAKDTNYKVKNEFATFRIEKAENYWTTPPSISDIFVGGDIKVEGKAYYGEINVEYYLDEEMTRRVNTPLAVGNYYALVVVAESDNYKELCSDTIAFEVRAVLPLEIDFTLHGPLTALSKIKEGDYTLIIRYNDGTSREAEANEVDFIYQGGSLPRGSDERLTVLCLGISLEVEISVAKAEYDLSGVYWDNLYYEYDGTEKAPSLVGLPGGVRVESIVGSATNAGEYIVSAILSYDEENYKEPQIPTAKMTISKRGINPSFKNSGIYSGDIIYPVASEDFLVPLCEGFREVGEHIVAFVLTDESNYYLLTPYATFTVHPAPVEIVIKDKELYLFERVENIEYEINTGERDIHFDFEFYLENDMIYARSSDRNIILSVTPGRLVKLFALSPSMSEALCVCFILFIFFALLLAIFIRYRGKILALLRPVGATDQGENNPSLLGAGYLSIDLDHAERLLTDTIARTLLRRDSGVIETRGSRRAYINVDVLSDNFAPGDRVDINILKAKGLIPKDAFTVKVLGRGRIDKPLFVYANSFSLSAVKMIALTGGEAHKVTSENKE